MAARIFAEVISPLADPRLQPRRAATLLSSTTSFQRRRLPRSAAADTSGDPSIDEGVPRFVASTAVIPLRERCLTTTGSRECVFGLEGAESQLTLFGAANH